MMGRRLPQVYLLRYNDKTQSMHGSDRMRRTMISLLALGLVLTAACSDEATGPGTGFDLTVRAVDRDGHGVEGLDLMVVMDSDLYQDGPAAAKAAVAIRFSVPVRAPVAVTIEDAARGLVQTLVADTLQAGEHRVMWNGLDPDGIPLYSGLYYAHLVARDRAGQAVHDERQPMYMARIDFDQATLGTTDGNGEIVLEDRRLFPALYGGVEMHALDENGDDRGVFPMTHTMRFYLRDPAGGGAQMFFRDVRGDDEPIVLEWTGVAPAAPGPGTGSAVKAATGAVDPPDTGFKLWPPYPNPFN